jgi:periplasmic protein TonB
MENQNYLQKSYLDILFEGRNKDYGAYLLRKDYNKRMLFSLSMLAASLSIVMSVLVFHRKDPKVLPIVELTDVNLVKYPVKPPVAKPKKDIEPIHTKQNDHPKKLEVKKNTSINIVKDELFNEKNRVHKEIELIDTKIGSFDQAGEKTTVAAPPAKVDGLSGDGLGRVKVGEGTGSSNTNNIEAVETNITHISKEAQFPSGRSGWTNFLTRSLRADIPTENGAPAGRRYTVIVAFTVDKNGLVSNVKAENDPGYGMADEAVRVIKMSGKWIPAIQNDRPIAYRQRQSITFDVLE